MTFPARSIIAVDRCDGSCGDDECRAVLIDCDCGTGTHLTVEFPEAPGKYEAAYTCDGCTTVNWFTVSREAR